jgi:hypothetical protein
MCLSIHTQAQAHKRTDKDPHTNTAAPRGVCNDEDGGRTARAHARLAARYGQAPLPAATHLCVCLCVLVLVLMPPCPCLCVPSTAPGPWGRRTSRGPWQTVRHAYRICLYHRGTEDTAPSTSDDGGCAAGGGGEGPPLQAAAQACAASHGGRPLQAHVCGPVLRPRLYVCQRREREREIERERESRHVWQVTVDDRSQRMFADPSYVPDCTSACTCVPVPV